MFDTKFDVALFEGADTNVGARTGVTTWEEFATSLLEGHEEKADKSSCTLLIPVKFAKGATQKTKENVESVSMGALDFDNLTEEQAARVVDRIVEEGLEAVLYSTWGHAESMREKGLLKFRVLLPFTRPVESGLEWDVFWPILNGLFCGLADQKCKDCSHGYFLPAVEVGTPPEARILEHFEGKPIDVDFLLSSCDDIPEVGGFDEDDSSKEKISLDRLRLFAKRLKRSASSNQAWMGSLLEKVIKGDIFAEEGERDNTAFKLAQDLGKEFPHASAKSIANHFRTSLSHMGRDAPTVEDVALKIQRAQREVVVEEQRRKHREFKASRAQKKLRKFEEYNEECIAQFAAETGCGATFEMFEKRLIVQCRSNYYVFNGLGYEGPHLASELLAVCRDWLPPAARPFGFDLMHRTEKRSFLKTPTELMDEYGVVARRVFGSAVGVACFDEQLRCFREAWHPVRDELQPEECPEFDQWITDVSPTKEVAEGLRDWLALATDLSRPISMLVFIGKSGVGKSSFATGVSRLWNKEDAIKMSDAFESDNNNLRRTPVLLADESLPRDNTGRVPTDRIRSLISSGQHRINAKHLAPVEYQGYFRTICAVNNAEKVSLGKVTSREDAVAVANRMHRIEIPSDTSAVFNYELFVNQDGIAKHCLWLRENRKVSGYRFVTEGNEDTTRQIILQTESVQILSWVWWFLNNRKIEEQWPMPAFVAKGHVYVTAQGILKYWEQRFQREAAPAERTLVGWLKLCAQHEPKTIRRNGKTVNVWRIDKTLLEEYVRELGESATDLRQKLKVYTIWSVAVPDKFAPTAEEEAVRAEAIELGETDGEDDFDDKSMPSDTADTSSFENDEEDDSDEDAGFPDPDEYF